MRNLLLLVMTVVLVGCAGVDWDKQVGTYTYNQAIKARGAADSVEKLDDGSTVATWVIRVHRNWQDKLILIFDSKGKLVSGDEKRF